MGNGVNFALFSENAAGVELCLFDDPGAADGGCQVGNFPVLWAEWNGKYRDSIRRYWKGDES